MSFVLIYRLYGVDRFIKIFYKYLQINPRSVCVKLLSIQGPKK